ncbi:hypothetical protein BDR07DRAFT_1478578 [Suillus spraguei]|nr:hypothetical protein BDR07DRAFT_1478578 [Suillus spraguei]
MGRRKRAHSVWASNFRSKKLKADVSDKENACPGPVQELSAASASDSEKDNMSDNNTHLAISSFEHWYGSPLGEHGAGRQDTDFWADVSPIFGLMVDKRFTLNSSDMIQSNKSQSHSVLCEEVEDEEDLIAIRGVRWREKDQTPYLLEEIPDSHLMDFHPNRETNEEALPAFESDDINAESEDDDGNDKDQDLDAEPDARQERIDTRHPHCLYLCQPQLLHQEIHTFLDLPLCGLIYT